MSEISTEEKIQKAAREEFAEFGLSGARVDRIAERAGINKAMIYYHFKGKEALYEAILIDMYKKILGDVFSETPEKIDPEAQFYQIVEGLINFMKNVEPSFIRIMLREISSGGEYFKKIAVPNLMIPALGKVEHIIKKGVENNKFNNIHPRYTFIQTIGSVIFFNMIRITLEDTDIGKNIFQGDYFNDFKNNLLNIMQHGILKKDGI